MIACANRASSKHTPNIEDNNGSCRQLCYVYHCVLAKHICLIISSNEDTVADVRNA